MKNTLRSRMTLLHTWVGVLFSALLFVIFWAGSLSVFDKEIDRWMMPSTRLSFTGHTPVSIDKQLLPMLQSKAPHAAAWTIILPSDRVPYIALNYGLEEARKGQRIWLHPDTLQEVVPGNSKGASGFIYPLHHNLTLRFNHIGSWIVGIASMGMLCLLISGIIIHRKIFSDFFTLRLFRSFGRSNLDIHNLTGVALTPFYILITLSGLIIAFSTYFPDAHLPLYTITSSGHALKKDHGRAHGVPPAERQFLKEALGREQLKPAKKTGQLASIDQMIADAEKTWGRGAVYFVRINHPNDAKSNVMLRRHSHASVSKQIDYKRYRATDGKPLNTFEAPAVVKAWNFIAGMHYLQFKHWTLRWLYFLAGLTGCAMIATGLFFWLNARRSKAARNEKKHVLWMDAITIAAVSGVMVATLGFMLANQWLPAQARILGIAREQCEVYVFYMAWIISLLHAISQTMQQQDKAYLRAWWQQLTVICGLCIMAVISNWLNTGHHLYATLTRPLPSVAGVDIMLLAFAWIAWDASRRLRKHCRSDSQHV